MIPYFLLAVFIGTAYCRNEICTEVCPQTEYKAYLICLKEHLSNSPDLNLCIPKDNSECHKNCTDCNYPLCNLEELNCTTRECCVQVCNTKCKESLCEPSECSETCVNKNASNDNQIRNARNVTTTIIVHNIVNTSAEIPSTLIQQTSTTTATSVTESEQNKTECCLVIGPRQCVPQPFYPFVRCFHLRSRVCASYCTSKTVHQQTHKTCYDFYGAPSSCNKTTVYIPQPQPRCIHQPYWPYVLCGYFATPLCEGCYDHYGSFSSKFPPSDCSLGCYDDGYGEGPYYRQGPFYRPGFSHVPSCHQMGTCNFNAGFGHYIADPSSLQATLSIPPSNPQLITIIYTGCGYPPISYGGTVHTEEEVEEIEKTINVQTKRDDIAKPNVSIEIVHSPPVKSTYAVITINNDTLNQQN